METIFVIVGCLVGLGLVILLSFGLKNKDFRKLVYRLVVEAENAIKGTKKGQERFDYVLEVAYEHIPEGLQWFLTKERIGDIIEWAVAKMKDKLKG